MSKHLSFVDETNQNNAHHVKFNIEEDEFKQHHERLEINRVDDNFYNVNLGYLKVDHYYKIAFDLDEELDELVYLKNKSSKYITLKEMKSNKTGATSFTFIFYAYKEKSEKENVCFGLSGGNTSENGSHSTDVRMQICFEAKVLGEHQGKNDF